MKSFHDPAIILAMKNIKIHKLTKTPIFRKIAMGTWKVAKDPSVYGLLEIDMTHALVHIEKLKTQNSDIKITPTHLIAKGLSLVMKERPEINGLIRGSRIYLREHVSLFFQVNIPGKDKKVGGANLAGAVLHKTENMSVSEIAKSLHQKATNVRENKDKEIKKNFNIIKKLPWCLTSWFLDFSSWLIYGLNLGLPGIPKDPFGSAMITNVGAMGIDLAYAPLCPYTRVPLLLTVGAIDQRPWVVNDEIVIRPILRIGATFDHRFIDGVHAAHMARLMKKYFAEPEKYLV